MVFYWGKDLRRDFSDNVLGRASNYRAVYSGFRLSVELS